MNLPSYQKSTGIIGLLSILVLIMALIVFGNLNPDFSFLDDYISVLGAKGEPYGLWWNLIGFGLVGLLLMVYGWKYGVILNDKWVSILLSLFGLGFAFTALPIDIELDDSPVSKAHIVAICLGLAFWLFGLSRMSYNKSLHTKIRFRANITAVLLVLSMFGFVLQWWSMPVTHRLVFGIVFGWTTITSIELLNTSDSHK